MTQTMIGEAKAEEVEEVKEEWLVMPTTWSHPLVRGGGISKEETEDRSRWSEPPIRKRVTLVTCSRTRTRATLTVSMQTVLSTRKRSYACRRMRFMGKTSMGLLVADNWVHQARIKAYNLDAEQTTVIPPFGTHILQMSLWVREPQ